MIQFTIPAVPIAQPRQRHALIAGHVRNYTPSRHPVQAFKATCRMAAKDAYDGPVLDCPIRLRCEFVLPRPKSMPKRQQNRTWHTKRPDIENLAKSVMDALTGLVWRDDSLIWSAHFIKTTAGIDEQPHVAIVIHEWEAI